MKILITTDWYIPVVNGVVTSVVNLTKGLTEMGHEVRILTLSGSLYSYKKGQAVYIGSIGVGKIYPDARMRMALAHRYIYELIQWHPDIIHSQCEFSTFFLARKIAKASHAPIIHTYHTVYEDYTHYFSPNVYFGKAVAALFSRKVLGKTEAVIVPSEKIRTMLLTYGITKPITTIPSGLDLNPFLKTFAKAELKKLRSQHGIKPDQKVLLYIGRLAEEKNIEELFQLLSRWQRQDFVLLLVGDGPHRRELAKTVQKMNIADRVIFTGMVPPGEIAKYYRLGDVFVSASQSETQGLTYIEAMVSELPVVAKADPCLKDIVRDCDNGFQYHSFYEFKDRIDQLLSDDALRQKLGQNAAVSVRERFSVGRFSQDVAALYGKLVNM
ncbi:MAG TPA: glycosyltransferase family 4 protein [Clostridiales bacterium]|nr:glycosyltransferase family 4 protein [Clostridiales bacterium]